ncbi:ABC transporter permease [Rhodoplanes sp. Z2-YC6860]|uniref:ABC transporter permease n=1 Tax=Rhodoplanes sp. Z2-YC6860 TaxID=674703 RepID=UPI00078CAF8A|nr:ABC transporter permease [Rhodoplanes sp. Z2-YC6860]AMN39033.1 binding-protein-dependent transport system inner membrane protein [Rhodoplanes sp. Z2-YC6860]
MSAGAETGTAPTLNAAEAQPTPRSLPRFIRKLKQPAIAVLFPVAVVMVWHFATYGRKYSLIPPPSEVAIELYDLAFGGIYDDAYSQTLLTHLLASVSRVYGGFGMACLVALPLGLMIGRLPFVRQLLDPTLQVLRPIPVTAWLPLAMIIFGLGPRSAVFLVFLGAFYPVLVNTIFGVRSVDPRLFEAASMLGCEGVSQFFKVVLPASLPAIFTGLRLGLGFAWVVIVVGEMTGVQTGLGAIIMEARQLSRTEIVISGMIVIGIAGFISDRIVMWLGQRLLRWSPNHV